MCHATSGNRGSYVHTSEEIAEIRGREARAAAEAAGADHATLPLLETGKPHHDVVAPIFYMDTIMGIGFQPTEYVDVTNAIDTKVAMLKAHSTQLTWLRDHDGVDIVEQMKTTTRFRGQQCGVEYAEGFVPCLTWLRTRPRRLLP